MDPRSQMHEVLLIADRIYPLGGHPPVRALLVRDGRVAALGDEGQVRALASPQARVERLEGATVTPGITDAHVHLTAWAMNRRRIDLRGVTSIAQVATRVEAAAAAAPGHGWLLGHGWNLHHLDRSPRREDLDRVAPDRPVVLESNDIHSAWLNSEALRRCGITRDTPDPSGGEIARDPQTGEPTGLLLEFEAKKLAYAHVPPSSDQEVLDALHEAQQEAHRLGITGVHSVEPTGLRDFESLRQRGQLRLRVLQHIQLDQLDAAIQVGLRSGFGGEWIRIGGVKMFLDGALGSRTAWMREPYTGTAQERGIQTLASDDFRDAVRRAANAGIAATIHAIGDAAVELAVRVLGEEVPRPAALPHRIEHLQLCPPELWDAVGRAGIVASMQATHLLTDIPAAERHWGHERSRGAYAFAPLLRSGATLALGSDVPVETIDPRPGLFAAVCRETWTGPWEGGEWYPEHRLSSTQALSAYTEGPAAAAGWQERQGRLLPGYDADLVAWDRDLLSAAPEQIREMSCLLTMVAGEVVHRQGRG